MTPARRRTVVVTGANSGIGLAVALQAAAKGLDVVGTVRSDSKADVLLKAAADAGVKVGVRQLEVTDAGACAALIEDLPDLYGLVNNAGFNASGAVEDTTDDYLEHALATMTVAPIRLARLAVPILRARGHGRIVNVSSVEARAEMPLLGSYCAAKHALQAATGALSMEVKRDNIVVTSVEPGGVRTSLFEGGVWDPAAYPGSTYENAYERMRAFIRFDDRYLMSSPEKVAGVVCRALTEARPKPCYLVGPDAWAVAATTHLPRRAREWTNRKVFGL